MATCHFLFQKKLSVAVADLWICERCSPSPQASQPHRMHASTSTHACHPSTSPHASLAADQLRAAIHAEASLSRPSGQMIVMPTGSMRPPNEGPATSFKRHNTHPEFNRTEPAYGTAFDKLHARLTALDHKLENPRGRLLPTEILRICQLAETPLVRLPSLMSARRLTELLSQPLCHRTIARLK